MDYIYISDFFGLEFRTKIRRTRDGQSQNFLTTTSSVHNLHAVGRWLAWKTSAAATAKEGERDGVSEQTGVGAHGSRGLLRSPFSSSKLLPFLHFLHAVYLFFFLCSLFFFFSFLLLWWVFVCLIYLLWLRGRDFLLENFRWLIDQWPANVLIGVLDEGCMHWRVEVLDLFFFGWVIICIVMFPFWGEKKAIVLSAKKKKGWLFHVYWKTLDNQTYMLRIWMEPLCIEEWDCQIYSCDWCLIKYFVKFRLSNPPLSQKLKSLGEETTWQLLLSHLQPQPPLGLNIRVNSPFRLSTGTYTRQIVPWVRYTGQINIYQGNKLPIGFKPCPLALILYKFQMD